MGISNQFFLLVPKATGGDMAASESAKIQQLIKTAEELAKKGERQKALTELHKVLDIDPGNRSVKATITELEREVSAMRNFRKTRDSRTHKTGTSVNSGDFVEECIARSEEAFAQGDEVRALQELERAKRHDPDNKIILRKILTVRRQIKTDNLYDLALAKLRAGDPATAVRNARAIFTTWPAAPVLLDLLAAIEAFSPSSGAAPVEEIEEIDEIELDESLEVEQIPAAVPEKEITSPADAAINSIRGKISRSDYSGALAEARKAGSNHPENATIKELVGRLESLAGDRKEQPDAAIPVKTSPKEKKKAPVGIIAAVLAAIILVVLFVVVKPFGPGGDVIQIPVDSLAFQPYAVTFTVQCPESYSVTIDGEAIILLPDGSFIVEGDSASTRKVEIRSSRFETYMREHVFTSGQADTVSVTLDSLGTSTVQLTLQEVMPEGVPAPAEGAIAWMVDGAEAEKSLQLVTGVHVFQAILEGYNSVPESILIDYSEGAQQLSLALLSQTESQITLTLGGDIPGNAIFTIDGNRVGTAVRRISEVLPFGTHSLRVDIENYEPWTRTITLDATGYSVTVVPVEIVTTGRLLIAPEPWANVSIDGVSVGQTPMAPIELEAGSHSVRLTNPDYEDQALSVLITVGEDTSIRYTAAERQPDQPDVIAEEQPIIPPFPISQVGATMPGLAMEMGDVHGYVTLDVLVNADGSVGSVAIVSDELGLGCGAAAVAAVRQWVFNPATQGGVPVAVTTRVQVRFDTE
jgi:TonB family protein